jgi:hypothetical protein
VDGVLALFFKVGLQRTKNSIVIDMCRMDGDGAASMDSVVGGSCAIGVHGQFETDSSSRVCRSVWRSDEWEWNTIQEVGTVTTFYDNAPRPAGPVMVVDCTKQRRNVSPFLRVG